MNSYSRENANNNNLYILGSSQGEKRRLGLIFIN